MGDFSADQIVGKNLTAAKDLTAYYSYPSSPNNFVIKRGNTVGTVASYVLRTGNVLWWQFYDTNHNPFYIQHTGDSFSLTSLTNQGAKTIEQQTKEEEDKKKREEEANKGFGDYLEEFGSGATKTITKIGVTAAVLWGLSKIITSSSKK
jgi:hypothetical protein